MEAKGLRVEEREHLDVIGADPMAEHKAVAAEWDKRRLEQAQGASRLLAGELVRWESRALRAEGKLAELGRMLDEYRDKGRPMPTYSDLIRVLGS